MKVLLLVGVVSLPLTLSAQAQDKDSPKETTQPAATGGNVDPDIKANDEIERNGRVLDAAVKPDPTESNFVPGSADLAPEIKVQLEGFKTDRDRYLIEYKRLLEKLRRGGVTEEERREFREQFREQVREQWQKLSDERKERGKARVDDLRRKMPSYQEVLENAREQARDAALDQRPRRIGTDED